MEDKALEVTQVGVESLNQISKQNPYLALLLVILILLIVLAGIIFWKTQKANSKEIAALTNKLDEKNEKLYEDAKGDLHLILAFEQKLDAYLEKGQLVVDDVKDIKDSIKELRTYLEFIHK